MEVVQDSVVFVGGQGSVLAFLFDEKKMSLIQLHDEIVETKSI